MLADPPETNEHSSWIRRAIFGAMAALVLAIGWRVQRAVRATLEVGQTPVEASSTVRGNTVLRHAKGFTIEYRSGCKILRVARPWQGTTGGVTYVLVPRGQRPSRIEAGAMVVEIPVRRAISLSTVHAQAFLRLGIPEALVGMAGVKLLNAPELVERARQGHLIEISDGSQGMDKKLDFERIRLLEPELILASGYGDPALDQKGKLLEAGFKVALNTEWLEETPLGRAEWIKFAAAFLGREAEAERIFSEVERNYEDQMSRTQSLPSRPTVMSGSDYRGTWYMPGGKSYVAAFIRDAGGDYLWKDDANTGSLSLKMEAVLDRARRADVWLMDMSAVRTLRELVETDNRNALFEAYRRGQVYTNDARVSPGGGNDYWESGVYRPDLVLADLIAILHPELSPSHECIWYRRLPAGARP